VAKKSHAPDISERTIIDLSGRTATYYEPNKNKFDFAIGGMPFIMAVTDNTPYKRQTAPFRTERYDTERDPGEHTLAGSGYWIRSQSSWHYGDGIQFTEPLEGNDNEIRFRFRDSVGIDPWTPGEISLHKSTSLKQAFRGACRLSTAKNTSNVDYLIAQDFEPIISTTTTTSATSGSTTISISSTSGITVGMSAVDSTHITAGTTVTAIGTGTVTLSAAVTSGTMASGTTVTFMPVYAMYTINTTSTPWVTYASLGNTTLLGSTSDGSTMYVATTDNIYDININTGTVHLAYVFNGQKAQRVELKYVKSRVIAGVTYADNTVAALELAFPNKGSGASINISTLTPINGSTTLPLRWYWDGITEAAGAIYLGGYSGDHSIIYKLEVDNTGALGTIITAATLPRGEVLTGLYGYLGTYIMIGTSKGVRVAQADTNNNLTYGPIVYHNENGVHDFEARDSYVWATSTNGIDLDETGTGYSGTYRINLAQPLTLSGYATPVYTGVYAKASDVYADNITGKVSSVRIYGTDNLVAFAVDGSGIWIQSATDLVESGYIRHGRIRYSTLENKAWKRLRLRTPEQLDGAVDIFKVNEDATDEAFTIVHEGTNKNYDYDLATVFTDVAVDASFKLVLSRNSTDATTGAVVYGLGIKALPTPTRARIIQVPLFCYDKETDKQGVILGYEGYAHDRLAQLETMEATGKTAILQDFNAGGEPLEVIIEQVTFTRSTPSNRNYKGYGGIVTIVARTVA
jgi:hypothetical protein